MNKNLANTAFTPTDELRVISFSGGRTSAMLTIELLKDEEVRNNSIVCFCNTGKEREETLVFVARVAAYIYKVFGKTVVWLEYCRWAGFKVVNYSTASRKGEPFEILIRKRKFVPNAVARFCTQELKIRVIKKYILSLGYEYWTNVVGIRYDEPRRYKIKEKVYKERWDIDMPLVRWKIIKEDVLGYWQAMPFNLELKNEYEGNCDLCHLKGMNKKKAILRDDRTIGLWWQKMEVLVGGQFRSGYSVSQLLNMVDNELPFPELDDDNLDCFCNID
ncbi:MAG: Nin-like protein [Chitinophagia bacterium]|nr:Nin-like protein [Chitinophagia bacterium]